MPKDACQNNFKLEGTKKFLKHEETYLKTSHKNWGIFIFITKKRQSQVDTSTSHREFQRGKGKTENKGLRNKNIKAIWIVWISHLLKDWTIDNSNFSITTFHQLPKASENTNVTTGFYYNFGSNTKTQPCYWLTTYNTRK